MIPKIIHYCWLSDDPIPTSLQSYMQSWKEMLPDYKFTHWSFKNFDKSSSQWVSEAFDNKKYAFAADYIRLYALYNYGGIYLDMDVEVVKSFNKFLSLTTMLCFENTNYESLEVAAFGAEKGSEWVKDCLDYYADRRFVKKDGSFDTKSLPTIVKECLTEKGYIIKKVSTVEEAQNLSKKEIPVFPYHFFSPKSYLTGKIKVNSNTYSIHHFAGSWLTPWQQFKIKIHHLLGF